MNYYYDKSILLAMIDTNLKIERFEFNNINYGDYIGNYKNKYHLFLNEIEILLDYQVIIKKTFFNIPTIDEIKFILNVSPTAFEYVKTLELGPLNFINIDNLYYSSIINERRSLLILFNINRIFII